MTGNEPTDASASAASEHAAKPAPARQLATSGPPSCLESRGGQIFAWCGLVLCALLMAVMFLHFGIGGRS